MKKNALKPTSADSKSERPFRIAYYTVFEKDEDPLEIKKITTRLEAFVARQQYWTLIARYVDILQADRTSLLTNLWESMMQDARNNLFDLLVTPDLTHFATNTACAKNNLRDLHAVGVGVYFADSGICSLDSSSAVRAYFDAEIARDASRYRSSQIKAALQKKVDEGLVLGNDRIYGYQKVGGHLFIDEREAEMVRLLFSMYETGAYGIREVADELYHRGYRNRKNNKISHITLANIVANPKYKGNSERISVPNSEPFFRVHYPSTKDILPTTKPTVAIPAIVSEEQWERANAVLVKRNEQVKSRLGKEIDTHLFTGKLFCARCDTPYYRREYRTKAGVRVTKWLCSGKIKNGAYSCSSFAIEEKKLSQAILRVFEETKDENDQWLEDYTQLLSKISNTETLLRRLDNIDQQIAAIECKKQKLLSFNAANQLDDQDFLKMNSQLFEELKVLSVEREKLTQQYDEAQHLQQRIIEIQSIYDTIAVNASEGIITRTFVEKFIERIDVIPNGDGRTATLEITIFSGESFTYEISSD